MIWVTAQLGGTTGHGLVRRSVVTVVSLPERGALAISDGWNRFWSGYVDLADKAVQNRLLLEEIRRKDAELNRHREILAENERLKRLLDIKSTLAAPPMAAEVIGRNPSNWFNTLTINRGSDDGVALDMAAISSSGIVGRVVTVYAGTSRILLLTDPSSAIAVTLQRSRENCILKGQVGSACEIKYLHQDADIKEGDVLVSSGLDGIFPKGVEVARVTGIDRSGSKYFLSVKAAPVADMRRVEEILLVSRSEGK